MNDNVCFELVSINSLGIIVKNRNTSKYITFDECAQNYANEKSLETNKCVASRDITKLTYTFYTYPRTKVVFKKCFVKDFLLRKSAVNKFIELQKAINMYGYTSYDLS